jgi:hypothetical protein
VAYEIQPETQITALPKRPFQRTPQIVEIRVSQKRC